MQKGGSTVTRVAHGPFRKVHCEAQDLWRPELAQGRQHNGVVMAACNHGMQAHLLRTVLHHKMSTPNASIPP